MARTKSANPKGTKQSKTSAPQTEGNLAVASSAVEETAQKRGPQPVENLNQSQPTRSASQLGPNGSHSQNRAANISEDQIRERAYQLYLERGREHGGHEDDWYRAESELRGYNR